MTIGKGRTTMLDFKWQSSPGRDKHKMEERSYLWQLNGNRKKKQKGKF